MSKRSKGPRLSEVPRPAGPWHVIPFEGITLLEGSEILWDADVEPNRRTAAILSAVPQIFEALDSLVEAVLTRPFFYDGAFKICKGCAAQVDQGTNFFKCEHGPKCPVDLAMQIKGASPNKKESA